MTRPAIQQSCSSKPKSTNSPFNSLHGLCGGILGQVIQNCLPMLSQLGAYGRDVPQFEIGSLYRLLKRYHCRPAMKGRQHPENNCLTFGNSGASKVQGSVRMPLKNTIKYRSWEKKSIGPKTLPPSWYISVCRDITSNLKGYWIPCGNIPQLSKVRINAAGQPDTLTSPGLVEMADISREIPAT